MNTLDLTDAVFIQNDQIKTNSLKLAEYFGKRHADVLEKIEKIISMNFSERKNPLADSTEPKNQLSEFTALNFQVSEYLDEQGKPRPMYEMTKDGFMFLIRDCK